MRAITKGKVAFAVSVSGVSGVSVFRYTLYYLLIVHGVMKRNLIVVTNHIGDFIRCWRVVGGVVNHYPGRGSWHKDI